MTNIKGLNFCSSLYIEIRYFEAFAFRQQVIHRTEKKYLITILCRFNKVKVKISECTLCTILNLSSQKFSPSARKATTPRTTLRSASVFVPADSVEQGKKCNHRSLSCDCLKNEVFASHRYFLIENKLINVRSWTYFESY